MPSHTITDPQLKALVKRADEAYMDYLQKMKVLEGRARALLAKIETKKAAGMRSKLKKSK